MTFVINILQQHKDECEQGGQRDADLIKKSDGIYEN